VWKEFYHLKTHHISSTLLFIIPCLLIFSNIMYIGAYDDPNGSHVSIEVTSALFEGKRPVQRQQLVYKALWEGMLKTFSTHW
jgi:stress-induced morphogen